MTESAPCGTCGRPMLAFDGRVSTSGEPRWRHTDCAKAAAKDYGRVAELFNEAGYAMSRAIWGNYMYVSSSLPEDKQKELDATILPALHKLDAALSEAWKA